ncbi:MAG: aminotransferase class I/II-fold pyridoxal phosphate-dependent enzyme [Gemmatimonadota bacterium]|nr:aminotransferase class I/II-fold pyridoxal phosphate-dependent enzyme [Gemmatimonadota bacterium]
MASDNEPLPGPLGDLSADELRGQLHRMADWVADYRGTIGERAISPSVVPGEIGGRLRATEWEDATPIDQILRDFDQIVMPGILHWGHPAFLGYFGSTSNGPALLGEIAAAALNVSAMTWKTSPAATEMETITLDWVRELIGIPGTFFGVVYDTASIATLHALAAARERTGADIRRLGLAGRSDVPRHRIYASDQAHSSVEKAAIVLGIGEENVVRIATDGDHRLHMPSLRDAIDSDIRAGHRPLAVVATVGTTSTGAVDPVPEIRDLCNAHSIWLHVDAAYGGALGALEEGRWAMAGIEDADSIVVNPHKWLFVPLDFSALYTRHPQILRSVFSLVPEYLVGDATTSAFPDYMDYGIQLGRRFRALKAWMVFRSFGRRGIVSRIREHCRLANLFASWIDADQSFVRAAPVTMGIVCFRYQPDGFEGESGNALNEIIVDAVNAAGRTYLTRTRLKGRAVMRIGLGNVLTTEDHVAQAWQEIRTQSLRLGANASAFSRDRPSVAQ